MGVAGFGAVDARAKETIDLCTRATENDVRAETANMEPTDACPPPKWKCRTPITRELESPRLLSPANVQVPDPAWPARCAPAGTFLVPR